MPVWLQYALWILGIIVALWILSPLYIIPINAFLHRKDRKVVFPLGYQTVIVDGKRFIPEGEVQRLTSEDEILQFLREPEAGKVLVVEWVFDFDGIHETSLSYVPDEGEYFRQQHPKGGAKLIQNPSQNTYYIIKLPVIIEGTISGNTVTES